MARKGAAKAVEHWEKPAVDAFNRCCAAPAPSVRAATAEEEMLALEIEKCRDAIRQWEAAKETYSRALLLHAGAAKTLTLQDGGKVQIISQSSGDRCDVEALLRAHPELTSIVRTFVTPGRAYSYPKVRR